jgi:nucleotide sugar dehydrogenase
LRTWPHFEHVYGFQRDSASSGYKINMLNRGESPLKGEEPGLKSCSEKVVGAGKFSCTADFSKIAECDAVTLAIQTPFKDKKDLLPDFTPLIEGLRNVGRHLTPGTLVVLESTITPGTTAGMAREILEGESGLVAGKDFALAHAPERVMVGRLLRNIREHDRIVGGIDEVSTATGGRALLPGPHGRHGHPDDRDRGRGDEDRREHLPRPPDRGRQPARPLLRGDGDQRLRRPGRGGVAEG